MRWSMIAWRGEWHSSTSRLLFAAGSWCRTAFRSSWSVRNMPSSCPGGGAGRRGQSINASRGSRLSRARATQCSAPIAGSRPMQKPLDSLIALLDLEELEVNLFRGREPRRRFPARVRRDRCSARPWWPRDARSTTGSAHSFHAYFLRPGDPTKARSSIRSTAPGTDAPSPRGASSRSSTGGRSSTWRRPSTGPRRATSTRTTMPDVPDPESLPTWHERSSRWRRRCSRGHATHWLLRDRPIDMPPRRRTSTRSIPRSSRRGCWFGSAADGRARSRRTSRCSTSASPPTPPT